MVIVTFLLLLGVGLLGSAAAAPVAFPGAQWEEAAPEARGLDPAALRGAIE
jgi:hypothetical protein